MSHPGSGSSIHIDRVSKIYPGGVVALDSVSLEVDPGEFITFLGPSGSGKTTTLNIIAGFTTATSGRVLLDGLDLASRPPHKRNLGVVFQNYALFPHMTVHDNIAFGLKRRGVKGAEQRALVDEALEMVRLQGYGSRRPAELSGGQQQRVALARALVYRPSVLLLDEPLGALDKRLREQMQIEVSRLHRDLGMTFLFVTHDQEEALALSDRIALFEAGRLVQLGTPEELYKAPQSLFAAEFLGESNILMGVAGEGIFHWAGQSLRIPTHQQSCKAESALVIRPERVFLTGDKTAASVDSRMNSIAAIVTDVTYLGSHRRVGLRFADGSEGLAREPIGQESLAFAGQAVMAQWDPEHSVVVPATKEIS